MVDTTRQSRNVRRRGCEFREIEAGVLSMTDVRTRKAKEFLRRAMPLGDATLESNHGAPTLEMAMPRPEAGRLRAMMLGYFTAIIGLRKRALYQR